MKVLTRMISPVWILRVSLGISYLYSGYDLLVHPTGWYWAIRSLPQFIQTIITDSIGLDHFLRTQGAAELMVAFGLVAWFLPKWALRWASFFVVAQMAFILIFVGLTLDTFRDIVILGAGLALFIISLKR